MKIDFQRVSRLQLNVQFRSFVMVSLTSNVKGIAGKFYCIRQCGRCQHHRHKFESSHLKCYNIGFWLNTALKKELLAISS